jgi:hypothetical protein
MTVSLNNGTLTFGDGSTQTTKTPTVVSAFTNDSGYTTDSALSPTYATITTAVNNYISENTGVAWSVSWYNRNGSFMGSVSYNCNCNC